MADEKTTNVSKQSLLELVEISILLNSYDDIFSAFDPNNYSERTLSDDFIAQVKRFSQKSEGKKMSLKLILPKSVRNEENEKIIVKRLHSYFKDVHKQLESEIKSTNRKGLALTAIGIAFMALASYISFIKLETYLVHLLFVLFEPAGWFLLWAGLDHLVYTSKEKKKDFDFYSAPV